MPRLPDVSTEQSINVTRLSAPVQVAQPSTAPEDQPAVAADTPSDAASSGDDQPWEIYHYRPIPPVSSELVYESEDRGLRLSDLEPNFAEDPERTKRVFARGVKATIGEPAQFLQRAKRRVREIVQNRLNRHWELRLRYLRRRCRRIHAC